MKTHISKRYTLPASVLLAVGGCVLACFLWVKHEQWQYSRNRRLIEALSKGEIKRALYLMESGADPNTRIMPLPAPTWQELLAQMLHLSTPLRNNSPTALMFVCGSGGETDFPDPPENFIHGSELLPLTRSMLSHGANVDAIDKNHATALMFASVSGLTDRMALLLEHGARVDLQDDNGDSALLLAAMGNNPEAVKLLLKYHANPNLRNTSGKTPLTYTYSSKVIRLLKQDGATE